MRLRCWCCLLPHGCSGRRRARPPARLGGLTAFGAAPRSPPVPSGPSGALHTGGAVSLCMAERVGSKPGQALPPPTGAAAWPSGTSGGLHTSGVGSLMCGLVSRLEDRPGPAAAHGRRSQANQSLRHRASKPTRAPRPGPVDQAARLFETGVAFARVCLCGIETVIAFACEKRAFLVHFSVAVVMPVSAVPCWG